MENLFRHIDSLLLHHECVIVPGIGGFLTHRATGFYDEDEQAFYPPYRTIGFNPQLTLNDGTLVHSYMEADHCDYKTASKKMQRDIQSLKDALRANGTCCIDGIGILKQGHDGNYSFIPIESGALTPSLFGLSRFEMKPLYREQSEKVITLKVSTLRRVASSAAAIIALFVLSIPFINNKGTHVKDNMQQATSPLQVLSSTDNHQNTAVSLDAFRKQLRSIGETLFQTKEEIEMSDFFTIVLACDVSAKNCKIYAEMIEREGGLDLSQLRVFEDHIYYGKYANQEAANEALRLMKDNKYFKIGWIKEVSE